MSDEMDYEVTTKRAVSIASKKGYVLGNSNNNDTGVPLTIVGPAVWIAILSFSLTKIPLFILFFLIITEFVIGYALAIRGGLVGALSILKYNVFSTKRKNVRN
jgi:hypothetical protein